MFKKIIVIVSLIAGFVVCVAGIELRTINETNNIEILQTRNLRAVKNAELIRGNIVDIEHSAHNYYYHKDAAYVRGFWKEYKSGISNINQLVIPLHSGNCESCHSAFATMRSEMKSMTEIVGEFRGSAAEKASANPEIEKQLTGHLDKLKRATKTVNAEAKRELLLSTEEERLLVDKRDYTRPKRAGILVDNSAGALLFISSLEKEINTGNMARIKYLLQQRGSELKLPVKNPPLKDTCYSCHLAVSKLHEQAKNVADNAYVLFSTEKDDPGIIKAVERFDGALTTFRQSTAEITDLSQIALADTMEESRVVYKRFQVVTITNAILCIFITLLVSALIIRWMRKRLSAFSTAISAITEGDYSHTIHIETKDEFADLAHAFNIMVSKVNDSQDSLKSLHLNTVKALIEAIEAKDPYTRGHSENVARYSMLLGRAMGLPPEKLDRLQAAALLHDIGKIGIHEDVLNKPDKLDKAEYEHIKTHPEISAQIVGNIPNLARIASIIKHHHEHYNGKGYVDGLSGDDIPLESRILAIADTFDAMTSDRPYRESCSKQRAFAEIRKCSGYQFDPGLVELFISALKNVRIKKVQKKATDKQKTDTRSA